LKEKITTSLYNESPEEEKEYKENIKTKPNKSINIIGTKRKKLPVSQE
jgi:hypothetical protein